MKRILICAAAAIVALASCSKTQVVYNDAPEEIGFKTVTGVMTKANLDVTHTSMGVFAFLNPQASVYFEDTRFTTTSDNKWNGGKYWPIDGEQKIDFVVYAPSKEDVTNSNAIVNYADKTLTLTIPDNTPAGDPKKQVDWLYGNTMPQGTKNGNKTSGVGVELSHALSKISVVLTTAETTAFKFVSLTLNGTKQKGTITIDYGASPMSVTTSGADVSYQHSFTGLAENAAIPASTPMGDVLVFPTEATDFTFKYKMVGSNETLTQPIQLDGAWDPSKHYTYTINIVGNQITIIPTVEAWSPETPTETVQ